MMTYILGFGMPSGSEWLIIGLIILLLFGAKRIPEIAKGLGKGIKEFKKATSSAEETFKEALNEEEEKAKKPAKETTETKED
ncbi:MAG: twin-arginine translocase TatA/TatE family subunit [Opitutales bacterium]